MAGWKKYFKTSNLPSNISPLGGGRLADPGYRNFQSQLPEVYTGQPNRVERYNQYEQMDMDSEVNAALYILAEFCTQKNQENHTAFTLKFKEQPSDNEVKILKEYLQQWSKMQQLESRMFRIARNLFKYGDGFFIRDPETLKWFYIDPGKITKIIDFARGTFKLGDKWIFSDQFKDDNDAGGQYDYPEDGNLDNCEHKPNPSFDLVRLGTTVISRLDNSPNVRAFVEQITKDDYDNSLCYDEDTFQLYIDIAHNCHNAVPIDVLSNPIFEKFKISKEKIPKGQYIFQY